MTVFEAANGGESEQQWRQFMSFLFAQVSTGKVSPGVMTGLGVTQTTTASANVNVAAGLAVVQAATLDGASPMVNDTQIVLDVLTANPVGGLPRNDIVVIDQATGSVRVIVGTPNASPTDPTVPTSAVALARLRHAASATTVPSSTIDDLRGYTSLFGANRQGLQFHVGLVAANAPTDVNGYTTVTHGAPFTPTWVEAKDSAGRQSSSGDTLTSTTFRIRILQADGNVFSGITPTVSFIMAG